MSTIATEHGGTDHDKASSFMSTTLEKVWPNVQPGLWIDRAPVHPSHPASVDMGAEERGCRQKCCVKHLGSVRDASVHS